MLTCPNTHCKREKNLKTITKTLRNHKIAYRWGYPTELSIVKEDRTYIVDSLEKGISLLEERKILPDQEDDHPPARHANQVDPDWNKVTNKNAKSHT